MYYLSFFKIIFLIFVYKKVLSAGIEPTPTVPKTVVLSIKLRELKKNYNIFFKICYNIFYMEIPFNIILINPIFDLLIFSILISVISLNFYKKIIAEENDNLIKELLWADLKISIIFTILTYLNYGEQTFYEIHYYILGPALYFLFEWIISKIFFKKEFQILKKEIIDFKRNKTKNKIQEFQTLKQMLESELTQAELENNKKEVKKIKKEILEIEKIIMELKEMYKEINK